MMTKKLELVVSTWALLGGVMLIAIVLVTTVNVGAFTLDRMARLVGSNVSGLPGYEDFVRLAISAAALTFFPYCQLRHGHVNVDLFARQFPLSVQRALNILWLLTTALVALGLAWYMFHGMQETRGDNAVTPVLGWAEWPFYIPGIVSLVLWAMVAVSQIPEERQHG